MATEINFDELINSLRDILKSELQDDWDEVKEAGEVFLLDTKLRLELYAQNTLTGEISADFLLKMLEEEKNILESELLALEVMGKSQAQNAIGKIFVKIGEWIFQLAIAIILK